MATFILSYPDKSFVPRGSAAEGAPAAGPAFAQWLKLCDEIHRVLGRIMVLDPSQIGSVPSVYAALLGSPFLAPGKLEHPVFLRSHLGEPAGDDAIGRAIGEAGLPVRAAQHPWQGQVDVIPLERNRFVLTGSAEGDFNVTLSMVNDTCTAANNPLLARPSTVPHPAGDLAQTGALLPVGSSGYTRIAGWIARGCPTP